MENIHLYNLAVPFKKYLVIDFNYVYSIDARIHQQFYVWSIKKHGQVLGIKGRVGVKEYKPGVVYIEARPWLTLLKRSMELVRSSPSYLIFLRSMLIRTIRDLRAANLSVERELLRGRPSKKRISKLFHSVCRCIAAAIISDVLHASFQLLKWTKEKVGEEDGTRLYLDLLSPSVESHYTLLSSAEMKYRERFLKTKDERLLKEFAWKYGFLHGFSIHRSPLEDPSYLKRRFSSRKMIRGKVPSGAKVRRQAALEKYYLLGPPKGFTSLHFIIFLRTLQLCVDHEELRHYWQLRTLRNFRELISSLDLDLERTSFEELMEVV